MPDREALIRQYFDAWLQKDGAPLPACFAGDALYVESHGPVYFSLEQIVSWFDDWNQRGTVLKWPIERFVHQDDTTVVEWYFECEYDGRVSGFDGISLIHFNDAGKIAVLKEFQSKSEHHYPYM